MQPLVHPANEAESLTLAMHSLLARGRPDEAFLVGRRALAQWQTLQEHERACDVLLTLAAACMEHEQGLEALALVRHAFRLARARVLPAEMVRALMMLGALHGRLHDFAAGESLLLQALSRARELHEPATVLLALNSLLTVLLEAHAVQVATGEYEHATATAERLLRHANHALAQSPPAPRRYADLLLRTHAAAALLACGRAGEALPVLRACMEGARLQDFRVAGLWARLHAAQGTWMRSDNHAAVAALQQLLPLLARDDPPRLRLAVMQLQARVAERTGDLAAAQAQRANMAALEDAHAHQVRQMQDTLRRNADETFAALAVVETEWLERGLPAFRRAGDVGLRR
jgi:tetratricopeptide (TPR) repeat protein